MNPAARGGKIPYSWEVLFSDKTSQIICHLRTLEGWQKSTNCTLGRAFVLGIFGMDGFFK